jgi:chromosome partitioning protein
MATTVSFINMKGGVGKTTLAFSLAWHCAWFENLKVLAVDLDPQSNTSQYFMGATDYLNYLTKNKGTIVDVFQQFAAPNRIHGSPVLVKPGSVIYVHEEWNDGSVLHLVPARLELSWVLKNPTVAPQKAVKCGSRNDVG